MAEKKRRGNNEGSIFFDPSRDRWTLFITLENGQRKKYTFEKRADAVKKKNEVMREKDQGTLITAKDRKLGEFLTDWLENIHAHTIRISTLVSYRKEAKRIKAGLGNCWLKKLTPDMIQHFYADLLKKGLAGKTVNNTHQLLHACLKYAVRVEILSKNVCDMVIPPKVKTRKPMPLSYQQARTLITGLATHRLEVLLVTAVTIGARQGELLALRWADVNLEERKIVIHRGLSYLAGYGFIEGDPKTEAGFRTVNIPEFLANLLNTHRDRQAKQRSALGNEWRELDLVFPNLSGGYIQSRNLQKQWKKVLKDLGLPDIHFHDLRHSAATILFGFGVNVKVISEMLGHSDISVTLRIYAHLLPSMQQEAMRYWDDAMTLKGEIVDSKPLKNRELLPELLPEPEIIQPEDEGP